VGGGAPKRYSSVYLGIGEGTGWIQGEGGHHHGNGVLGKACCGRGDFLCDGMSGV
jgi:hypothetical protein